ncbi:MAG: putative glycolipid-binding domain-containing protein [Actinomycetota bacterium]
MVVNDGQIRATGTQIGSEYELRYALTPLTLELEIVDRIHRRFDLDGADFFDLGFSPLFNSLPVMRDHLLDGNSSARDYVMRWISVPELSAESSHQRYEPEGTDRLTFIAGDFRARVEFDTEGFVTTYEGLTRRVGRTNS